MEISNERMAKVRQYVSSHGGSDALLDAVLFGYELGEEERESRKRKLKPITDEYTFERWWKLYDHKVGRDKCEVKWHNVLTAAERRAATTHTPLYVASTPDKTYRKHPYTYLNQKCWKDTVSGDVQTRLVEADAEKFMEYFNNMFEDTKIPKLTEMTTERKHALNVIYTLYRNDIIPVLNKVLNSTYLRGEDGKGGRTSFDQIFTQSFFIKIKEGNFDD